MLMSPLVLTVNRLSASVALPMALYKYVYDDMIYDTKIQSKWLLSDA